jgi:polyisoprenoid-binding protein YceI
VFQIPNLSSASASPIVRRMKLVPFNSFCGLACAALLIAPTLSVAAAHDYRFDTVHTQVLLNVSHLNFSRSTGLLHVKSGALHFDRDDLSTASVDVLIDSTSIDMGDAGWNDKLRSHEFLASERYPTLHFVSTSVTKIDDKKAVVHGKLTLTGMTRAIDLNISFNREGIDPYSLKWTAGFSATASLKRSDFGMSRYLPDIGDTVDIRIEAEALRDKDAAEQAAQATAPTNPTEH